VSLGLLELGPDHEWGIRRGDGSYAAGPLDSLALSTVMDPRPSSYDTDGDL